MNKPNQLLSLLALLLFAIQGEMAWAQATDVVCDKCVGRSDIAVNAIVSNRINLFVDLGDHRRVLTVGQQQRDSLGTKPVRRHRADDVRPHGRLKF